jgi:hypothetical protein
MKLRDSVWPVVLALTGCGGYRVPASHVANAQNAIAAAQGAGAAQDPRAGLHLRLAQDELLSARIELRHGNDTDADLLLYRARSDAELAMSLAQATSAKRAAQDVIDHIRAATGPQP